MRAPQLDVGAVDRRAVAWMTLLGTLPLAVLIALSCATKARAEIVETKCETTTHCVLAGMRSHESDAGETEAQKLARLLPVADAIDAATADTHERAILVALGQHESHFARYVLDGRCSDGPRGKRECDSGRAVGPWQIWRLAQRDVPDDLTAQALIAVRLLRGYRRTCGSLGGALSMYARGGLCTWSGAASRVATVRVVEAKMWRSK